MQYVKRHQTNEANGEIEPKRKQVNAQSNLKHLFYKSDVIKSTHNRFIRSCSKYVMSYIFIFYFVFTSCEMYSIPKESNYTAGF